MRSERLELAISALKSLNPNENRVCWHKPAEGRYVIRNVRITDDNYAAHIMGKSTLAAAASDDTGKTTCVGIDLDAKTSDQNPHRAARKFINALEAWDIPFIVHSSRSGKGIHIRTIFDSAVPVHLARAMYLSIVYLAQVDEEKAYDKVWPPANGVGLLFMPLQINWMRDTQGGMALNPYSFDPLPLETQLDAILDSNRMTERELCEVLAAFDIRSEEKALAISGQVKSANEQVREGTDGGIVMMLEKCGAVKRLIDETHSVPYRFWYNMLTNFRPFEGGFDAFNEISKADHRRYDRKALIGSWKAVNGHPVMCHNLDPDWTCPAASVCPARAPAGLPFALVRIERDRKKRS